MLQAARFNVMLAGNGRNAVTTLLANPVSIIILDFRTRFDSKDCTSRKSKTLTALTDADPFLPVVLTCHGNAELDHEMLLMADLVLHHPVQPSALFDGMDLLLSESLRERVHRKSGYIATLRCTVCSQEQP
jgi:hypothetical protein